MGSHAGASILTCSTGAAYVKTYVLARSTLERNSSESAIFFKNFGDRQGVSWGMGGVPWHAGDDR
jgi:hypothetical protein